MKRGQSPAICKGRRFLLLTAVLCFIWFSMDAFLFYSGPGTIRSHSRLERRAGPRELEQADAVDETEPSAMLFEDLLARDRKLRIGMRRDAANEQMKMLERGVFDRVQEKQPNWRIDSKSKSGSQSRRSKKLIEEVMNEIGNIERNLIRENDLLRENSKKIEKSLLGDEAPRNKQSMMREILENQIESEVGEGLGQENSDGEELQQPRNSEPRQPPLPGTWNGRPEVKDALADGAEEVDDLARDLGLMEQIPEFKPEGRPETLSEGANDAEKIDPERKQLEDHPKSKHAETTNVSSTFDAKSKSLEADNLDRKQSAPKNTPPDKNAGGYLRVAQADAPNFKPAELSNVFRFDMRREDEPKNENVRIRDYNVRLLPFDTNGPGEHGQGVNTSIYEQKRVQAMWNLSYFNQLTSDKISVERSIPDIRHPKCREKQYNYSLLPKVSVIICFTDEWWSALVRSVHSVLNRTPPELLQEIILLDDFSQRPDLKEPLGSYLGIFTQVRVIHLPERHGLIRARMVGVKEARGSVVVFLDSHVECNRGWLEPLVDALRRNPKSIVSPIIDGIDPMTFEYRSAPDTIRGGFSWNLQFQWRVIPPYEQERRKGDPIAEIRTPTIAGGLFAVSREYFQELGQYDPGLDVWGAENLELSFKTWMCGGSLEIIPCSRIGHVFRSAHPYTFPGKIETLRKNNMRVAKVWLDSYIDVVLKYYPQFGSVDTGDVSDRLALRKQLRCQSFDWYLQNVYPELYLPSATPVAKGELRNMQSKTCMDRGKGGMTQVYPCHGNMGSQYFQLTEDNRLEVFTECIGLYNGTLLAMDCNVRDFVLRVHHAEPGGPIVDTASGKCLGLDPQGRKGHQRLVLVACHRSRRAQKWAFSEYRNDKLLQIYASSNPNQRLT